MPYEKIEKTKIKGVLKIQPRIFQDDRGCYIPTFERQELLDLTGEEINIRQSAISYNKDPGVIRGLHFQIKPLAQGKLVQVKEGSAYDVAVDLRKNSPTFGHFVTETLTADHHNQLWIPPGLAHGYVTLEPNTTFTYDITGGKYDPPSERGIDALDPDLNIPWPIPADLITRSDKDKKLPLFKNVDPKDLF